MSTVELNKEYPDNELHAIHPVQSIRDFQTDVLHNSLGEPISFSLDAVRIYFRSFENYSITPIKTIDGFEIQNRYAD